MISLGGWAGESFSCKEFIFRKSGSAAFGYVITGAEVSLQIIPRENEFILLSPCCRSDYKYHPDAMNFDWPENKVTCYCSECKLEPKYSLSNFWKDVHYASPFTETLEKYLCAYDCNVFEAIVLAQLLSTRFIAMANYLYDNRGLPARLLSPIAEL